MGGTGGVLMAAKERAERHEDERKDIDRGINNR